MSDISFPRSLRLWHQYGQPGACLRTFVDFLVSNLDEYSPRLSHCWKGKVTKSLRFVFQLAPSARRTDETGFGLLLTPTANENEQDIEKFKARMGKYPNGTTMPNLATQIGQMLSTPNVQDAREPAALRPSREATGRTTDYFENGRAIRDVGTIDHSANLQSIIGSMLATPKAQDSHGGSGQNVQGGASLTDMIGSLPTPATRDYKGANSPEHLAKDRGHHDQLPNAIAMSGESRGLKLQPAFVECMMGFPIGWTDLKPSETVSCRKSRLRSSKRSTQRKEMFEKDFVPVFGE